MAWGNNDGGISRLLTPIRENNASVRSLHILPHRRFGEAEAIEFADALQNNETLRELYASGHDIGLVGYAAFARALKTNSTLRNLSLGSVAMGDEGVEKLSEGLKENKSLLRLDLENRSVGEQGCVALGAALGANATLMELNLSRNAINDDALSSLVSGLMGNSRLQTLDLSANMIGVAGAQALSRLLTMPECVIESVDLSDNSIGDEGLEALAQIFTNDARDASVGLRHLHLRNCGLTSASGPALSVILAQSGDLESLDLSENKIEDGGVDILSEGLVGNACLRRLDLSNNELGDPAASSLSAALNKRNKYIGKLHLSHNTISGGGAKALLEVVHIGELRLFNNQIGDKGVALIGDRLKHNEFLVLLDLGANALTDEGALALLENLPANRGLSTLELGGNNLTEVVENAAENLKEQNSRVDIVIGRPNDPAQQLPRAPEETPEAP